MIKNILNFKKNSLKSILMSSIIFVSAVASTAITISEVALASQSEDSFKSFNDDNKDSNNYTPWGWVELYEDTQKERDKVWKKYLACDSKRPEFSVFLCDPDKSPDSCTSEELIERAKDYRNYFAYKVNGWRDKNVENIHNKADEELAELGVPKGDPNYGKALKILEPYIKKHTDPICSEHNKNIEMLNKWFKEVENNVTEDTPFSCEVYKETWDNLLNYCNENSCNNDVENAVPENQSNPTNNDAGNYGCFIS